MQPCILSYQKNVELLFSDNIEPEYEFKRIKQKFFTHPLYNNLDVRLKILRTLLSKLSDLNLINLIINWLITKENVSLAVKLIINYPLTAQHSAYPGTKIFFLLIFVAVIHHFINEKLNLAFYYIL